MTNKTKQTNKKYKDLLLGILNVLKYKEKSITAQHCRYEQEITDCERIGI